MTRVPGTLCLAVLCAAGTAFGCGETARPPEDSTVHLRGALDAYLRVQALHHEEHGRYADEPTDLVKWFDDAPDERGVSVRILHASRTEHRAEAGKADGSAPTCRVSFVPHWVSGPEPDGNRRITCSGRGNRADRNDVRHSLETYLAAQDRHSYKFGEFAASIAALRAGSFERGNRRGVTIDIVGVSDDSHSAVAFNAEEAGPICGVLHGGAPPPLVDGGAEGEVTCRTLERSSVSVDQPAGVLLGLATPGGERTLWITFDGDSARLVQSGAGLVTPRDDGFWTFEVVGDRANKWLVGESLSSSRRDTIAQSGIRDSLAISYVGPRLLGYVAQEIQESEWRGQPIERARDWRGIVGPDLRTIPAHLLAHPRAAESLQVTSDIDFWGCGGEYAWTIARDQGRWVFEGFESTRENFCPIRQRRTSFEPRREFVDYSSVALVFVRAILPRAVDAVLSPRRDAVLALAHDSLFAFAITPTAIGRPRAVAAAPGEIVMAEWALGRHVERWTNELSGRLRP